MYKGLRESLCSNHEKTDMFIKYNQLDVFFRYAHDYIMRKVIYSGRYIWCVER